MNPQVERLESLLARVQHNRKLPRPMASYAPMPGQIQVEPVAVAASDAPVASLDAVVDEAVIVAETKIQRPPQVAAGPVLELEPHAPKAEARPNIDELDEPDVAPLPELEPIEPPVATAASVQAEARGLVFTEPPPPETKPEPVAARKGPPESELAAAVQLAAVDAPRTGHPTRSPVLTAQPAPEAPRELGPVAVALTAHAPASGPIAKIATALPPPAARSFGDLVRRSLALRPMM